jgi:hypothetical protein
MANNKLAPQSKNKLPWYEQALPMEGRATFLPFQDTLPGSVMNTRSWALPGIIAGAANAITAPGRAYSGSDPTFNPEEEAANFAMNVMGGGMGASRAAPAPAGSLGMNRRPSTYAEYEQQFYTALMDKKVFKLVNPEILQPSDVSLLKLHGYNGFEYKRPQNATSSMPSQIVALDPEQIVRKAAWTEPK